MLITLTLTYNWASLFYKKAFNISFIENCTENEKQNGCNVSVVYLSDRMVDWELFRSDLALSCCFSWKIHIFNFLKILSIISAVLFWNSLFSPLRRLINNIIEPYHSALTLLCLSSLFTFHIVWFSHICFVAYHTVSSSEYSLLNFSIVLLVMFLTSKNQSFQISLFCYTILLFSYVF